MKANKGLIFILQTPIILFVNIFEVLLSIEPVPKLQFLEQLPKNSQFCRHWAEKLQEPVTKQPVLEQAQFSKIFINYPLFFGAENLLSRLPFPVI
jgi:hypothetical protein